jgi:ubiquinone/menaquinone biosynthesis C-methylase UbiE
MCNSSINTHKVLGKRLNNSQGKKPKQKIGITTSVIKCSNCGLIYSNPQPIPDNIQDHYGIPPESYWNENYFKIEHNYFMNEIDKIKQLINFKEGMKFLDIGAGIGKAIISAEKAGFDCYGFEPSKSFYDRAISKMGLNPKKLKLGQIEEIDYPENYFDFISFGAVLEHLYNPSDSIIKSLSWLKPNGIIHIEVPSSSWLINKFINFFYKINATDYIGNISPMHEPYHLYEFSLKSFQEHSKKNKYIIAHHEYHVCETYMPKFLDLILKPFMKYTKTGMQLTVYLKKI